MLRTLLATSALASLLALGAQAQTAPATDQPAAAVDEAAPAPIIPEAADSAPQPADNMAAEPAPAPADNMAADPAAKPADAVAEQPGTAPADATAEQPAAAPAGSMAAEPPLDSGWTKVDVATISTDDVVGADVRTFDQQQIASIQDLQMAPDGKIENFVARFGGFLGFGETNVLLSPDEVTLVKDPNGTVFALTSLTEDALKAKPAYEPAPDQG